MVTLIATGGSAVGLIVSGPSAGGQQQNRENAALSKWRSHDYSGNAFVGNKACARCHTAEARTQPSSEMAQALSLPDDCQVLRSRPRLAFRNGAYTYQIVRQGNQSIYTVSD